MLRRQGQPAERGEGRVQRDADRAGQKSGNYYNAINFNWFKKYRSARTCRTQSAAPTVAEAGRAELPGRAEQELLAGRDRDGHHVRGGRLRTRLPVADGCRGQGDRDARQPHRAVLVGARQPRLLRALLRAPEGRRRERDEHDGPWPPVSSCRPPSSPAATSTRSTRASACAWAAPSCPSTSPSARASPRR